MSETSPLLRLEEITKHFGAIEALRGISFEIKRGEVDERLDTILADTFEGFDAAIHHLVASEQSGYALHAAHAVGQMFV